MSLPRISKINIKLWQTNLFCWKVGGQSSKMQSQKTTNSSYMCMSKKGQFLGLLVNFSYFDIRAIVEQGVVNFIQQGWIISPPSPALCPFMQLIHWEWEEKGMRRLRNGWKSAEHGSRIIILGKTRSPCFYTILALKRSALTLFCKKMKKSLRKRRKLLPRCLLLFKKYYG